MLDAADPMESASELGIVYWVTGLPGAGKTTVGRLFHEGLRARRDAVVFLDGDILREVFGNDLTHSEADRRRSAMRNARLCRMLASQGIDVVCATISMFHEVHRWCREHIARYHQVFLDVPFERLVERDQHQIYSRGLRGELQHVYGIDITPELPEAPEVRVDGRESPEEIVGGLLAYDARIREIL